MARHAQLRKKTARAKMKKPWQPFEKLSRAEAQKRTGWAPEWLTRCFVNNKVIVMICDGILTTKGYAVRAMIQALDGRKLEWPTLQRAKSEVFGHDVWAVQYFPAEGVKIDQFNVYWLWVFPGGELPIPMEASR